MSLVSSRSRPELRLSSVQILRALAALTVVWGHALHEARHLDPAGRLTSWDGSHWAAGVDLFFIISGFIMMWTFGHRFGEVGAAMSFMRKRLLRIVPPYWFFTALMCVAAILFADRLDSAVFTPGHAVLSFLFIPHISPDGDIQPILSLGWTLLYEMFFYGAFALALILPRVLGLAGLCLGFVGLYAVATGTSVLPHALQLFWGNPVMFEFLLGIGVYLALNENRELPSRRLVVLLAGCAVVGGLAWWAGAWQATRLFHFGLPALVVFAVGLALLPRMSSRPLLPLVVIGDASYALYLAHPFALELIKQVVTRLPLAEGLVLPAYLLGAMAAAVAGSVVFHIIVEKPVTGWLGRVLRW